MHPDPPKSPPSWVPVTQANPKAQVPLAGIQPKASPDQGSSRLTHLFIPLMVAIRNADEVGRDGRAGYFSLESTGFIVDVRNGDQRPIQYPGDDNPLVTKTAYEIW